MTNVGSFSCVSNQVIIFTVLVCVGKHLLLIMTLIYITFMLLNAIQPCKSSTPEHYSPLVAIRLLYSQHRSLNSSGPGDPLGLITPG